MDVWLVEAMMRNREILFHITLQDMCGNTLRSSELYYVQFSVNLLSTLRGWKLDFFKWFHRLFTAQHEQMYMAAQVRKYKK
jgi:hypothetical protein